MLLFAGVSVAYWLVKHQKAEAKRVAGYCGMVVAVNLALVASLSPMFPNIMRMTMSNLISHTNHTVGTTSPDITLPVSVFYLSPLVIGLFVTSLVGLFVWYKKVNIGSQARAGLMFLGSFAIVLPASFTFSIEPFRTLLDFVSIMAILAACLVAMLIRAEGNRRILLPVCFLIVGISVALTMTKWIDTWV